MSHLIARAALKLGTLLVATAFCGAALAADVELLPDGLLTPTTKEQTKPNQFKKAGPWRIGVSFGGVGNTWIVQMIQEMKFAAAQRKEITEFIFVEANWQAAKQVADVEDLLTKKVDAIIIGPISAAIGAPLAEKAAKTGIPVVVFGAF
ncbi:MAG: substrate-binding domain-containing protein, partial [Microbacteriaceae bacterium]|nr:substrate-binding domain-containing protein [Burkholderiaceae bacterium]